MPPAVLGLTSTSRVPSGALLRQVRHVRPVPVGEAVDQVAAVYSDVVAGFGLLAPPIVLHSPDPDVLTASWIMLRQTLLARGHVRRASKELVAAVVSSLNECSYCVDVHTAALAGREADAEAVATAKLGAVLGGTDRALVSWLQAAQLRSSAPVSPPPHLHRAEVAELTAVATTFRYLNRMVSVYLGSSPVVLPRLAGPPARWVRRTRRALLGRMLCLEEREPRSEILDAVDVAPVHPPPWSLAAPAVAQAMGMTGGLLQRAGRQALSEQVREVVLGCLDTWDGSSPPLTSGWLDEALTTLSEVDRPSARLALLVALAPHRIGDSSVTAARRGGLDDAGLIKVSAWAAWSAALATASWSPAG